MTKNKRDYTTWPSAIVSVVEDVALVGMVIVIAQALTGKLW